MRSGLLAEGLEQIGADALLVLAESSHDPSLAALIEPVHLGQSFVIARRGRPPVLGYMVDMERGEAASSGLELLPVARDVEQLRRAGHTETQIWAEVLTSSLQRIGLEGGRIAVAGSPPAGRSHEIFAALGKHGFGFTSGDELLLRCRKPKSDTELDAIRQAAEGTCRAFRRVAEILAGAQSKAGALWHRDEPLTAGALRCEVATTLAGVGLEQPEGNIISCGADAGVPHTRGTDSKRLEPNRSIIVDLYPRNRLFADCTRTFCVGEPPEEVGIAHTLCLAALDQARTGAVSGVKGADLQNQVCSLFEDAGFATNRSQPGTRKGYVHGLGHGVGYELHEYPTFRAAANGEGTLAPGDVFTLEPGLYEPEGGYGVRLEDLFVMTDRGPETLTPLPWSLDPRAW